MSTQPTIPSASPLAGATVRSAMQLGLFHCPPDADLRTLARVMAERTIHCVVVGENVVSDLDLMGGLQEPAGELIARDVATPGIRVLPTETLEAATRLMTEHRTAHLLVVSPQTGLPVGMISSLDVARFAAS